MLAERAFIETIRKLSRGSRNPAVVRGIGDDCAILRPSQGYELLVTTDLCVENVHFRRKWHPAASAGHHCLARGLSDIAAMGGEPLACFLSLGLPSDLSPAWIQQFLKGLQSLAKTFKVELAGGDTSAASLIMADIIVVGQVPAGKALLRSGARPGDRIFVTGNLGASAEVLDRLFRGQGVRPSPTSRHFYPEPRVKVGRWLREHGLPTAMIDLSDGLSVDLTHICAESKLNSTIRESAIPVAKGASLSVALNGGEDYELLFTASPEARIPGRIAEVPITEIGWMHPGSKSRNSKHYRSAITILGENGQERPLPALGWQHFSKRSPGSRNLSQSRS